MKVKNMVRNRQSTYLKLMQINTKNLKKGLLMGVVALAVAFMASKLDDGFFRWFLAILSFVIAGAESVFKLIKGGKDAKLDMGLVVVAILIPFFMGKFVLAATTMAIYKIATTLISYMMANIGKDFRAIYDVCPKNANVIDDNANIRQIASENIVKGMKLMVKAGEVVPVDCIVTEGFSEFDTSKVYAHGKNESLSSGDKALAGYVNISSSVTCVAACDYDESLVKDLNRMADMAETTATIGEKRFIKIARWYPIAVLVLAILVLLVSGFMSSDWGGGMSVVSVLLIAATTGSFMVAVPLFSTCAVWKLKKKGLAISSSEILDEIADINCIAFEKNGIMTDGVFKISDTYTAEGITEEDLLMITGICVGGRTHPISRIFTPYMNEHLTAENVMEFPGKGVECTIMGKTFICGTEEFIKECGVDVEEIPGYRLYITIDNVVMGAVSYEDKLSESSANDIEELRKVGVEKVVMFTTDKEDTAKIAFGASGADEYVAEVTPFGRAEAVSKIKQEEGATCAYVGEALGGEQAINEADVGISLISKENNGLEFAKVTLLGKLRTIADAIELARVANNKVEIHFYCASAAKIIITLLGLFGALNIASALVIDVILTMAAFVSCKEMLKK